MVPAPRQERRRLRQVAPDEGFDLRLGGTRVKAGLDRLFGGLIALLGLRIALT